MSENVGEIVYIIRADTAQLLSAGRNVVDMTNDLQSNFDDTDESADNLNTTLSKLAATIKLIFAAGALREMAKMVQSYQEMAERVQMATSSQAEFESVQRRLLNTANGTYRSLAEAQELYIRSADGLRSMGYSTEQAIDVQDSMSYAFVKNAASADRAESAISAFTKAINTGKVSADQWESITTAIPTVINDIASASGKTAGEIRALGAAGKLTATDLSEGLRQSLDDNTAAAAGMSNNLTDAGVRMKTAFTEVLVAIEDQTGALQTFTNGLIAAADTTLEFGRDSESMAGFIDAATIAAKAFALVLAGRYAGALKAGIASKVQAIAANRQMITAENQAAQAALFSANATQRRALADKEAAISALNLAQAEYNVARGSAAEMLALDNLIAAKTRATAASIVLTEAETAQAAATVRATAAASAASVSMGLMRGALSLLGGPAGIVMIAAGALLYWWQSAKQAKEEALSFADSLDGVIAKMKEMNQAQLVGTMADIAKSIEAQKDHIDDLNSSVKEAQSEYDKYITLAKQMGVAQDQNNGYVKKANEWLLTLNQRKRDVSNATDKLNRTTEQQSLIQGQLNQKARESEEAFNILENNLKNKIPNASSAAITAMASTIQVLDSLNKKAANAGNIQPAEPEDSPEAKKLIQNAERRLALSKLEGEARARLQAQYDADDANLTDEKKRRALEDQYAETERLTSARKAANKEAKKSADDATQFLSRQQSALDRLNTGYADGSLELAKYDAVMALGNKATDAQIAKAEQQAEAIWEVTNALKNRAQAEQAKRFTDQEIATNKTTPDAVTGAVQDPTAQIALQEQQKLAALQQYQQMGVLSVQQYEDAKTAIQEQAANARRKIAVDEANAQTEAIGSILGSASQGFDSLASIIENTSGKSSGAYVAMFAAAKAFAIAQSTLSLNTAIMQAMADPTALTPAQKMANYAAIASAGASLLSNIASVTMSGGRRYGGTVSAGNAYRVNEDGRSEIFQTAGGQQAFIPNQSGKIIPADKAGGGSFNPVMNLTINTTGGIGEDDIARLRKAWSNDMLKMMVDQSTRPGGLLQGRRK
ncbi:tape measure protein [Enterobacter hormaechei subsp. steigerwaltii]